MSGTALGNGRLGFPSPAALTWCCLPFDALQPRTLYALLRLRAEVFVVEQGCLFQDLDGVDPLCLHVLGEAPGPGAASQVWACSRLLPAGIKYAEAGIGRVATAPSSRGTGLGHALMTESVRLLHHLWGRQPIRIGAQARLQPFYGQHGFESDGPLYLEDGIDHIEMIRR